MLIKEISLNTDKMLDFQQWRKANNDDFSLWDYIFAVANVEVALALTKLFWPDFVEHEGGIFLSQAFNPQVYEQWKAQLENDITAIEQVMNHQHIDDLLPETDKVSTDNLFYLGQAITQMWESRLKSIYPNQDFEVFCNQDEDTVVLTFYQIRTSRSCLQSPKF
ncbi:MAG: hypothetical protein AB4426_09465 [Xenococcaceae cyanobacterium]